MKTVLRKISELSASQISYTVAMLQGHEWRCPWLLEKEGYQAWILYENAWGRPHPDYCNSWVVASQIMVQHGIFPEITNIERHEDGTITFAHRFKARSPQQVLDCEDGSYADHPLVAVMRCYLTVALGKVVSVPEGIP